MSLVPVTTNRIGLESGQPLRGAGCDGRGVSCVR